MPCLKPPKREGECAPSVRKGRCWVALHWAGTARATSPLDGDARTCTTEPEGTKHPILQRRYLFSERSVVRGWQDSRAVHDSRGLCSEKSPFLARSSRRAFPEGGLRGISDAWRAYPAIASSFRMHGARILPRTGDFPVRGRFRDAWSAKLAMDCRPGTHRGGILPRIDARERTAREYCHYQSPESAFAKILPWTNAWIRPAPNNCRPPRKKNGAEGRTWRTPPPVRSTKDRVLARLGRAAGYGAVQRHRRTLGNAPRRNIAMADNAPRDKRRRAFCSPSFAVLFTARVAIGAFAVGSRRHLAVSLIEAHIR